MSHLLLKDEALIARAKIYLGLMRLEYTKRHGPSATNIKSWHEYSEQDKISLLIALDAALFADAKTINRIINEE
jgi:hypothetical protein